MPISIVSKKGRRVLERVRPLERDFAAYVLGLEYLSSIGARFFVSVLIHIVFPPEYVPASPAASFAKFHYLQTSLMYKKESHF